MNPAQRAQGTEEYFFSKKAREISQLKTKGVDVLNLAIGSPDLPPPASVREMLAKHALSDTHHDYQPYQGIPSFKESVYKYHSDFFSQKLSHLSVLPLFGAKEGLFHTALAFIHPGDRVLVPDLAYPAYGAVSTLAGGRVVTYPLVESLGWIPDLDSIEQSFRSGVKMIWFNCLHMPTGAVSKRDFQDRLIHLAIKYQVLVVSDNPYALFADTPNSIFSIKEAENCAIEIHSLSKSHNMAGWRIGWAIGSEKLIRPVLKIKSQMDSGMFYGLQKAAEVAMSVNENWFKNLKEIYQQRRALTEKFLRSIGHEIPNTQEGLFVWSKVPKDTGDQLSDFWLQEKGVFVTPGSLFGEKGAKYIRVSLCQNLTILQRAFERIHG